MVKWEPSMINTGSATSYLVLGVALSLMAGCAVVKEIDDPCALANRDATFSVLVENSMANLYNACLGDLREDIIEEWGQE